MKSKQNSNLQLAKRISILFFVFIFSMAFISCNTSDMDSNSKKNSGSTISADGKEQELDKSNTSNKESKTDEKAVDILDFKSDEDFKKFMVGTWMYKNNNTGSDVAWLNIAEDHSYTLRVISPDTGKEERAKGNYRIEHYVEDANGIANAICFDTAQTQGDFFKNRSSDGDYSILHAALGDNQIIMKLIQLNNGNTLISGLFSDFKPVFRKNTELKASSRPHKNMEFYAICYKMDAMEKSIWLDDVDIEGAKNANDIVNINAREAVKYKFSKDVEFSMKTAMSAYTYEIYRVKTDNEAHIIEYELIEMPIKHPMYE